MRPARVTAFTIAFLWSAIAYADADVELREKEPSASASEVPPSQVAASIAQVLEPVSPAYSDEPLQRAHGWRLPGKPRCVRTARRRGRANSLRPSARTDRATRSRRRDD